MRVPRVIADDWQGASWKECQVVYSALARLTQCCTFVGSRSMLNQIDRVGRLAQRERKVTVVVRPFLSEHNRSSGTGRPGW